MQSQQQEKECSPGCLEQWIAFLHSMKTNYGTYCEYRLREVVRDYRAGTQPIQYVVDTVAIMTGAKSDMMVRFQELMPGAPQPSSYLMVPQPAEPSAEDGGMGALADLGEKAGQPTDIDSFISEVSIVAISARRVFFFERELRKVVDEHKSKRNALQLLAQAVPEATEMYSKFRDAFAPGFLVAVDKATKRKYDLFDPETPDYLIENQGFEIVSRDALANYGSIE